ncbi:hypothetical protein LCGC14_1855580 [marine sediment metagenome]|uniref:Solute-binding protein family 3/N-terminal domain-containing protein n=1 Tax=marine sediment metagenome TaxID=412755 RepID=A0A0F9INL6_9ZZZZ
MFKQKLITIITLVMLLCACDMQQQQSQLSHIKAQNKIRVGTLAGASNYYEAVQGEQGFEYELAQEFADHLGVELEMVPFFNLSDITMHNGKAQDCKDKVCQSQPFYTLSKCLY